MLAWHVRRQLNEDLQYVSRRPVFIDAQRSEMRCLCGRAVCGKRWQHIMRAVSARLDHRHGPEGRRDKLHSVRPGQALNELERGILHRLQRWPVSVGRRQVVLLGVRGGLDHRHR